MGITDSKPYIFDLVMFKVIFGFFGEVAILFSERRLSKRYSYTVFILDQPNLLLRVPYDILCQMLLIESLKFQMLFKKKKKIEMFSNM